MNAALSAKSRRRLDERFKEIGPRERYSTPVHGWVKAIRQALGMTTAQLAQRMGIRQPSVVALEQSEVRGTIELATLRRAAEALDCTLVYALVPNRPLESTVRERARAFVRPRRTAVEWSMQLEDQRAARQDHDEEVDEIVRTTNPRRFWDQSGD
jgi:predicted DNA-binding mobile mystery protein A